MILGQGRARERLLALAAELGVAEDVALPGFVPEPYAFMAHADLFAFTSRWEGLGFVIIEALAVGTPVVATDCPSGPREILQDGRIGPLVPVGDAAALAAAMHPDPGRTAARSTASGRRPTLRDRGEHRCLSGCHAAAAVGGVEAIGSCANQQDSPRIPDRS